MAKEVRYDNSHILNEWKEKTFDLLEAKAGHPLNRSKVFQKLDTIIYQHIDNPKVSVINNYTNQSVRTDLLTLIDLIEDNQLIIAGGGCLFHQHGVKRNLLTEFIIYIMDQRKFWKAERKKYKKGTAEYIHADIMQSLMKLLINSLYGCLGYPGFVLYNVFLAEAITNQGKHIITSAIACFEGFLGDSMIFDTPGELFNFLSNISKECNSRKKKLDISPYRVENILSATLRRLLEHCSFDFDDNFRNNLEEILSNKSEEKLHVIFYKNNLLRFLKNDINRSMLRMIFTENGEPLLLPYKSALTSKELQDVSDILWDSIETFIYYDYPVYDRLRKAAYRDKARSLYTDTDSVFISLDHLVQFCFEEVVENSSMSEDDVALTAANIMMIFVNYAIDKALKSLCKSLNIKPEWAERLGMKNEFFFKKMVFTPKKKRYLALALLQEGVILNDGKGLDEIKGFDFIKATTKEYLKEFYTSITLDDILYPPNINPSVIFDKMIQLKRDIEVSVRNGDMKFFKQASVKTIDQYKNPYQTQGVTAILFWNALCPDYAMDFPNDVNIVPVIDLRWEASKTKTSPMEVKNIREFASKYPDEYNRLYDEIYGNSNPDIQHMGLKYIATPKNTEIPIPKFIYDMIDYDKIISDAIGLFTPVMNSIGIKSISTTNNTENMSNLVDL